MIELFSRLIKYHKFLQRFPYDVDNVKTRNLEIIISTGLVVLVLIGRSICLNRR